MSNTSQINTGTRAFEADRRPRSASETKSALKTTEFFIYIAVVVATIITAAVTGDSDGAERDYFAELEAMQLIIAVTIGYMIARGLAKSGSREHSED